MPIDDQRLAKASRVLRKRQRLRQEDLRAPGRSTHFIQDLESGRAGRLRLDDLRAHFAALGANVRVSAWFNGALLDRLLDGRHAVVVDTLVVVLRSYSWLTAAEVSFSEFGERGSIDVFAANPHAQAVFVGEAKSDWGSVEETLRRLDVKRRLAPKIAQETFGFRPRFVGTALVFPDDRTARRVADRFAATLDSALPARGREIRTWLRNPTGHLRGLWFLTNARVEAPSPKSNRSKGRSGGRSKDDSLTQPRGHAQMTGIRVIRSADVLVSADLSGRCGGSHFADPQHGTERGALAMRHRQVD